MLLDSFIEVFPVGLCLFVLLFCWVWYLGCLDGVDCVFVVVVCCFLTVWCLFVVIGVYLV